MFNRPINLVVIIITIVLKIETSAKHLKPHSVTVPIMNYNYLKKETTNVTIVKGALTVNWEVVNNFPHMTWLEAVIFRNPGKQEKNISKNVASICKYPQKPNLPDFIVNFTEYGQKCPTIRNYTYPNSGQYKFENILKPKDFEGSGDFKIVTKLWGGAYILFQWDTLSKYVN